MPGETVGYVKSGSWNPCEAKRESLGRDAYVPPAEWCPCRKARTGRDEIRCSEAFLYNMEETCGR